MEEGVKPINFQWTALSVIGEAGQAAQPAVEEETKPGPGRIFGEPFDIKLILNGLLYGLNVF